MIKKENSKTFFCFFICLLTVLFFLSACDKIKKGSEETMPNDPVQNTSSYKSELISSTRYETKTEMKEIKENKITAYEKYYQKDGKSKELVIELDPGHGGYQSGASNLSGDVLEKDVNLKIAQYLKEELECYDHVRVYLTREDDTAIEIDKRTEKAIEDQADILISLHNNAEGDIAQYKTGCTVLTPRGVYDKKVSLVSQELACCVLMELEKLGIDNRGLLYRISENESTYPDGSLCDYYGIIRNGVLNHLPSILIEHSFIDREYEIYLFSDEKLRDLAHADANGIANYFHLTIGDETPKELKPYEITIMTIISESYKDNYFETKTFFKDYK